MPLKSIYPIVSGLQASKMLIMRLLESYSSGKYICAIMRAQYSENVDKNSEAFN